MTTYTQAQLAARVLKDLGLLGVDESPTAEELSDAELFCASEIAQMEARGIPIWGGGPTVIPEHYLTLLSRRIGLSLSPSYGLAKQGDVALAIPVVERDLRTLGTVPATGQAQTAEYF